jgi:4-hydroxy-3-methylbut-2-en-1-yl diphosphate reductase
MSDVLVTAPLLVEALAIRSAAPGLRVRTTGMGPERARAAVPALSADPASAMLVLGFGGGLRTDSRLCEVVMAEQVIEVDEHGSPAGEPIACQGTEALARALSDHGLQVRRGLVASVDRIITGQARERMLACGALAVDMESAWVAAAARGRPFAVLRVLSDTPDRELRQRLPVGPPLPTLGDAARATRALRQAAKALAALSRQDRLHTVFSTDLR